jgi:rhodanese-related sulfurtransferase
VARELMDRGFREVHALRGGFKAWRRAGFPVEPAGDPNISRK